MNPFFAIPIFFREIKCPSCRKNQVVALKTLKKGAQCKYCGSPLPAPKI